jgi:DNA-binding CsgD family transcriptional regulator
MIDSEGSGVPAINVLRGLYGFTQREAEFAALLMRGLSIKESAGALGVTVATARTFLARVTAKTDSHSQAELMARLLAVPQISVSEDIATDLGQKNVPQ